MTRNESWMRLGRLQSKYGTVGRCLIACLFLHLVGAGVVYGQTASQVLMRPRKTKADNTSPEKDKAIDAAKGSDDKLKDRTDVAERLARVQKAIDTRRKASPDDPIPAHLTQQMELLKWLDVLFSNREANLGRKTVLNDELQRAREQTESLQSLATLGGKPCSFLELDDMRDRRDAEQSRHDSIRMEIDAANASLKAAKVAYDENETKRRQIREQLDTEPESDLTDRDYELSKLKSRVCQEAARQRELELEVNKLELALSSSRSAYLRELISQARNAAQFSRAELDEKIAGIDAAEADYKRQLDEASAKFSDLDRRCRESNRSLEESDDPSAVTVETAAMWTLLSELNQEHVSLLQRVLAYAGSYSELLAATIRAGQRRVLCRGPRAMARATPYHAGRGCAFSEADRDPGGRTHE